MAQKRRTSFLTVGLTLGILLATIVPLADIKAVDSTPPVINWVNYSPRTILLADWSSSDFEITCSVTDISGIADVKVNITGPTGFHPINESMPTDFSWYYFNNNNFSITAGGTYYFFIWVIDTNGNSVKSTVYHFIILSNFISYAHVNGSNSAGPWDGTLPHPFQSIQEGINAVQNGGIVFIHRGLYHAPPPLIETGGNQILVIGESQNDVVITNFGNEQNGIYISRSNVTISNLTISGYTEYGLLVAQGLSNILIRNCTIRDIHNEILNDGIGLMLSNTVPVTVTDCNIYNNDIGISLVSLATNKIITNCNIYDNRVGINLTWQANNNRIYHNNFINNTQPVTAPLTMTVSDTWDDGRTGNYWDDYQAKYPQAMINTTTGTWETPYQPCALNFDTHPWVNPNGILNNAPTVSNQPTGANTGEINRVYTYTTRAIDPEGDQVWYQWKFGSTTTSWLGPYPSSQDISTSYIWTLPGTFQVAVKAKDSHNLESTWSPSLSVIIATHLSENNLIIHAPSSAIEEQIFQIMITSGTGMPLENVTVRFGDEGKQTNITGIVIFTAPSVTRNTIVTISAEKATYDRATATITIFNQGEPQQNTGWVYGETIDAAAHTLLQAVEITVALSNDIQKITYTDSEGRYVVLLPVGTYTITPRKQGYIATPPSTIVIIKNTAFEHNFQLEKNQTPSPGSSNEEQRIIEYTIQQQAALGTIGGRISLSQNERTISYYTDDIQLALNTTPTLVTVTVGAENRTTGTILIISLGTGTLADLNNITVTYDGTVITETTDVAEFFAIQENTTAHWLRFLTTMGLYLFIQVPHFSDHTITITSLIPQEVIRYTGIAIGAAMIILVVAAVVMFRKDHEE